MPLSEHEQRELEQIERYLAAEDPKFVSSIRNIEPKSRYKRRIVLGSIGFVLGVALLLVGVAKAVPLSIAGFLLMFFSMMWVVKSVMNMRQGSDTAGEGASDESSDGAAAPGGSDPNVISLQDPKRGRSGKKPKSPKSPKAPKLRKPRDGSGFMDRVEARWLRRRDRPWH